MSTFAIRDALIGDSSAFRPIFAAVEAAAEDDSAVLIEGEPGTGRELVAQAIHYASPRRRGRFVAVRPAIPAELCDPAHDLRSDGSLRSARGGTLYLKDLVGMPAAHQRRVARIVGKRSARDNDIRVIASADPQARAAVERSRVSRELYARLGTHIALPPLRARGGDVSVLAAHFARRCGQEVRREAVRLTSAAADRLAAYRWPGNVAELRQAVRAAVLRARGALLDAADFDGLVPDGVVAGEGREASFEEMVRAKLAEYLRRMKGYPIEDLHLQVMRRVERPLLELALEFTEGNQLRAAELLGINRNTLRKKVAELGVELAPPAGDPPRRR